MAKLIITLDETKLKAMIDATISPVRHFPSPIKKPLVDPATFTFGSIKTSTSLPKSFKGPQLKAPSQGLGRPFHRSLSLPKLHQTRSPLKSDITSKPTHQMIRIRGKWVKQKLDTASTKKASDPLTRQEERLKELTEGQKLFKRQRRVKSMPLANPFSPLEKCKDRESTILFKEKTANPRRINGLGPRSRGVATKKNKRCRDSVISNIEFLDDSKDPQANKLTGEMDVPPLIARFTWTEEKRRKESIRRRNKRNNRAVRVPAPLRVTQRWERKENANEEANVCMAGHKGRDRSLGEEINLGREEARARRDQARLERRNRRERNLTKSPTPSMMSDSSESSATGSVSSNNATPAQVNTINSDSVPPDSSAADLAKFVEDTNKKLEDNQKFMETLMKMVGDMQTKLDASSSKQNSWPNNEEVRTNMVTQDQLEEKLRLIKEEGQNKQKGLG